jgi:hypothetical protein
MKICKFRNEMESSFDQLGSKLDNFAAERRNNTEQLVQKIDEITAKAMDSNTRR